MNNNCEFCGGGYCLCDICHSMQEAIKEAEKVPKEEADRLFCDAEILLKNIEIPEKGEKGNGESKD